MHPFKNILSKYGSFHTFLGDTVSLIPIRDIKLNFNCDYNASLAAQVEIIYDNPKMKSELLIDMKDIATI